MSTTLDANDTYANAIREDTDFIDIEKGSLPSDPGSPKSQASSESEEENNQAVSLLIFFGVYMFCGSAILSSYEPDMSFFKAIYFNFVSLSSIGLGDIYPKSETYMAFTIIYIAIGLALTTIAIEIAADTLKKLHYYGRKIENVGNVAIWFGGKKLTMKQLVKNLGDQFNLPVTTIKDLDLDKFVDNAIKVEEGVIETLRPPPLEPADLMLESNVTYADDEKGESKN
uniref:Potassium channel domain-containing protein n=1 Tax=Panagrolaimus sp. PS1159 TaxID=55785 RepID=A0AC35ET13_9BILA